MSAFERLWGLRDRRPGFVALTLFVLAFLSVYPFVDWYLRTLDIAGPFGYYDFGALFHAVDRWDAGEVVYWRDDSGGFHGSYLYFPVYVLLFAPFFELAQQYDLLVGLPVVGQAVGFVSHWGFGVAARTWNALSVGLLWAGLVLVIRECDLDLARWEAGLLVVPLVGFQPLLYSLKLGQVSVFLAATLCFAYVGMERGRGGSRPARLASGALTSVAILLKPFYAVSGAHLLRDRDRLAGAVAAGVGLVALSLAVFGVENHRLYLEVLGWGEGWGTAPPPPSRWHAGYHRPLYLAGAVSGALSLALRIGGILGVIALSFLSRPALADRETFALGLAGVPVFAPQAYTHDYVVLLPVVVLLVAVEFDREGRPWLPVVALWLLSVQTYGVKLVVHHLPPWAPGDLLVDVLPALQPGLWGTVILLGLAAYRVADAVPGLMVGSTTGSGDPGLE